LNIASVGVWEEEVQSRKATTQLSYVLAAARTTVILCVDC